MSFAVVKTGGKQYRVTVGSLLTIDRLADAAGSSITLGSTVAVSPDGTSFQTGSAAAKVAIKADIIEHFRGPKIRVATYKPKKRQHRTMGHRQELSRVKVTAIG
jgi:large subunit ribosomal protein L21